VGGDVSITSKPDEGTLIVIFIPYP